MATDAVDLALACYRAPLEHKALLAASAPLPEGMNRLLKLVHHPEEISDRTGVRPEELSKAARFLIQQLCFARGASHYRVLGLESSASLNQIKEHYHLLMRLFHPDRNAAHDTWTEHFASRVNLAWKVLSKQNSRASYDEGLTRSRALILVQSAPYTMGGAARGPAGGNHRPRQSQRPVRPRANPSHRWRSALILNGMALGVIAFLVWEHFPEQTLRAPLTEDLRLSADAGLPLPNLQSAVKPTEPPTRQPSTPDRATAQTTAQETQGINREPDKNRDAQIEPGSDGMGLEKALKAAQSLVERMVLEGRSLDRSGGPPIQGERSEAEQEAETEQRRLKFAQEKGLLLAGQGGTLLASQTQPAVAPVEVMRTPDPKPVPEAARDQRPRQGKVNQTYRKGQPPAGRSTVQWRRTKSWYGTRGSKRR